jgi:hypothetical protein
VSRNEEIQDPNLADLPPEAFEEIEGQPTLDQLETRIRAKREQAEQDAGIMQSPHHADDIEPIEPPPAAEEPTEEPVEEEVADDHEAEEPGADDDGEEYDEHSIIEHDEEDDGEEFFVGRYRTKEDVEAGIREKDATIARLFRERIDREQGPGEQPQQPDQGGPVLDQAAWSEWAQTAVEEGQGVQGALAALEQGGQQGYDIYVAHWLESDDPSERAQAHAFNNEVTRQYAAQNARQAVQPEIERMRSTPPDDPQAVRQAFAAKHPDFEQLEPSEGHGFDRRSPAGVDGHRDGRRDADARRRRVAVLDVHDEVPLAGDEA